MPCNKSTRNTKFHFILAIFVSWALAAGTRFHHMHSLHSQGMFVLGSDVRRHRIGFCDQLHSIDRICSCRWFGSEPNPNGHANGAHGSFIAEFRSANLISLLALPSIAGSNASHLDSLLNMQKCMQRTRVRDQRKGGNSNERSIDFYRIIYFVRFVSHLPIRRHCNSHVVPWRFSHFSSLLFA